MSKKRTFWLTRQFRNSGPAGGCEYEVHKEKPQKEVIHGDAFWGPFPNVDAILCAKEVHRLTNIRLKPGGGPIEVELVEVKRRK